MNSYDCKTQFNLNSSIFGRFLQTIGSAQGRGLAKIVLKAFCKHFAAKENLDLLAFIRDKNTISQSLFNGLGFKVIRISSWFKIKPF